MYKRLIANVSSSQIVVDVMMESKRNKIVHRRVTPNIKFPGTHLYTSALERGTIRVKCLGQEQLSNA